MTAPVPDERPPSSAPPHQAPEGPQQALPRQPEPQQPQPSPPQPPQPQPPQPRPAEYRLPAGAPVGRPVAPTPPRTRRGAHILSLLAGLILTPTALAALAGGSQGVALALERAQEPSTAAIVMVWLAVALLGIVAVGAAGSALGPLVGGTLYGLVPGVGFLVAPEALQNETASLAEPLVPITGEGLSDGAIILGTTGSLLLLGLTLTLVGVAAHFSRRAGRATERAESASAAAPPSAPAAVSAGASRPPTAPTPPGSRRTAHLIATAVGLLVTPVGLALVAAGSTALFATLASDGDLSRASLVGPGVVGLVLLSAVVLSAIWSSLGLAAAGAVFGVLPGALGLVSPEWTERGVSLWLARTGDVFSPSAALGLYTLTTIGVLLAWGSVALLGAIGADGARRDGRRRERAELALSRAGGRL